MKATDGQNTVYKGCKAIKKKCEAVLTSGLKAMANTCKQQNNIKTNK